MKIKTLFNSNFFVLMMGFLIWWNWLKIDASKVTCWNVGVLVISFFLINRIEIWSDSIK